MTVENLCEMRIDFAVGGWYTEIGRMCGENKGGAMKYLLLVIVLMAAGAYGLAMGRGLGGFLKVPDKEDRKAQILNDPDIQTCVCNEDE